MPRSTSIVLGAALLMWCPPVAAQPATAHPLGSSWIDVPVRGGSRALAELAGVDTTGPRAQLLLDVTRLIYDLRQRENTSERRRGPLRAHVVGMPAMSVEPGDTVPVPLSADVWSTAIFGRAVAHDGLVAAILADRNAALLYYGLFAADEGLLEFLASHRTLLTFLYKQHAAAFSTLGRSVIVREGRIVLPGGPDVTPVWEAIVGASSTSPERFIRQLFAKNGSRLAYLLDALQQLDRPHQQFAFGAAIADPRARIDRFRALLTAFADSDPLWSPQVTPFSRMAYDATYAVNVVRLEPGGRLAGPSWLGFWTTAFRDEGRPLDGLKEVSSASWQESLDAASLVSLIAHPDPLLRKARLDALLFAQRTFPSPLPEQAADLLTAVRGALRMPALVLSLERMGLRDPSTFAKAVRHAQRLNEVGVPRRLTAALAQFQGALAVIDRARVTRWIDESTAGQLVQSALDVPFGSDEYGGQMAAWLANELLPALSLATGVPIAPGGREAFLVRLLAGAPRARDTSSGPADAVVRWEDLEYRVDLGAAPLARLAKTREKQASYSLDTAIEFSSLSVALSSDASTPSAGLGAGPTAAERIDALAALVPSIPSPETHGDETAGAIDVRAAAEPIVEELRKTKSAAADRIARTARPLVRLADHLVGETLTSLAYAPHLGDPDGAALLAGDVAARHDFGLGATTRARAWTAWSIPQEKVGAGVVWHVQGALLGLDVALASLALRRIGSELAPQAPAIHDNDRIVFSQTVALSNPYDLTDSGRDALALAQRRGREQVIALLTNAAGLETLHQAVPLDAWRRRVVGWTAVHQPALAARLFTRADAVWLAAPHLLTTAEIDAWGASGMPSVGCLCTRFPASAGWELVTGRHSTGLLATRITDLMLRIAEVLSDLKLPAALARDILAAATPDLIGEARPIHFDDWLSVAQYVNEIGRTRFEDFIASLTAIGPLVPVLATEP
jgi:hypothetical protein